MRMKWNVLRVKTKSIRILAFDEVILGHHLQPRFQLPSRRLQLNLSSSIPLYLS